MLGCWGEGVKESWVDSDTKGSSKGEGKRGEERGWDEILTSCFEIVD
jgi:hypothetical protein